MDLLQTAETEVSQDRHAVRVCVCVILLNYPNRTLEILIMEAVGFSEMSAHFCQSTRCQIWQYLRSPVL